jgi:glycosyltransferase involved in cell wall biosynthesis
VIGDGPERARLMRTAPENVRFLGRVDDDSLAEAYRSARALIFPGEEDFGLTPVEAMASGRPVIAYGRGGARETVRDGETGLFFEDQSPEGLRAALDRFEAAETRFDPSLIRAHAESFGPERFRDGFRAAIDALMAAPREAAWR